MLKGVTATIVISILATSSAYAADLMEVYQLARQSDPTLQKAAATRDATEQNKPVALSALLPKLSAGASYQRQKGSGSSSFYQSGSFVRPESTTDSTNKSYRIQLQQPLFHWQDWVSLGRAGKQVARARVIYHIAEQDLIVRLSKAYFDILAAQDTLHAAQAHRAALSKQLEQAQRKYDVGLAAITDVREVQAAHDQARAEVIADRQALIGAQDALIAITGQRVGDLLEPETQLPLKKPKPAAAQAWIDRAIRENLNLVSSRLNAQIAAKAVDIEQAARYPTLDLSLAHSYSSSDDDGTLNGFARPRGSQFSGNSLQLQLSVPIYSGGAIAARSRQAKYRHVQAEAQTQIVARQVKRNTRDAFLGVLTGISRVKALKEAVVSAKTALHANEAGLEVGTRTTVDVLAAREKLLTARTNYAQARYQYLIDGLLLQQAAGSLDSRDLASINQYLTRKSTVPGETVPPNSASSGDEQPKENST